MEKQLKTKKPSEKHALFKESINLNYYKKQTKVMTKSKKVDRLKTDHHDDGQTFDVKKHFKYLKQNHANFQELNYQNQNPIQNTYLNRDNVVFDRKLRNSCPLIDDLQRQPSIKKCNWNNLKAKCEQIPVKKNADTYWVIKEVSSKMKQWIK